MFSIVFGKQCSSVVRRNKTYQALDAQKILLSRIHSLRDTVLILGLLVILHVLLGKGWEYKYGFSSFPITSDPD